MNATHCVGRTANTVDDEVLALCCSVAKVCVELLRNVHDASNLSDTRERRHI